MRKGDAGQGVALVVVLLVSLVFFLSIVSMTASLSVSSRRSTADQAVILQAQYAAESGLARVTAKLAEAQALMDGLRVPSNQTGANIEAHVRNFCDLSTLNPVPPLVDWTDEQRREGIVLCTAAPPDRGGNDRYSLFTAYTHPHDYPPGEVPGQYWRRLFSGAQGAVLSAELGGDLGVSYQVRFGLIPREVRQTPFGYQFIFEQGTTVSTGEVRSDQGVIATRTVRLTAPAERYVIEISRPPFSRYQYFANVRRLPGGGDLYFTDGDSFEGHVHINDRPNFHAGSSSGGPRFTGRFTTAATTAQWLGTAAWLPCSGCTRPWAESEAAYSVMMPTRAPQAGVEPIPLPQNANSQRRAVIGGDHRDLRMVPDQEIRRAFNVTALTDGVYFSRGNGAQPNVESRWLGGIYVRGNVDDLMLSTTNTTPRRQIITIRQGSTTTRFAQTVTGTWTVEVNGVLTHTLSGEFNGLIFVEGRIGSDATQLVNPDYAQGLGGDGTAAPDLAPAMQLTVAASGNINIKRDLTYTDNPRADPSARNVLGVYSEAGNIKVDGAFGRDITIHGTLMASANGRGFGAIEYERQRGGVRINLLGGLIEERSQGIGVINTGAGYRRNYTWDPRLDLGLAPPFFPTQVHWSAGLDHNLTGRGVWQTVRGP